MQQLPACRSRSSVLLLPHSDERYHSKVSQQASTKRLRLLRFTGGRASGSDATGTVSLRSSAMKAGRRRWCCSRPSFALLPRGGEGGGEGEGDTICSCLACHIMHVIGEPCRGLTDWQQALYLQVAGQPRAQRAVM